MPFHNVVLNTSLTVNGWKPSRLSNVSITNTKNFSESRFARSPWPRHKYSIPFTDLNQSQRIYLNNFYDGRLQTTYSFLIWDRDESYLNAQQIGVGDGSTTVFQCGVTVGDSTFSTFKPLLHPVPTGTTIPVELAGLWPGTTTTAWTVTVGGVAKAEGTDYTVNALTGAFTFAVAPANLADVVITGWVYMCVRFYGEEFAMELDSIFGAIRPDLIECFNE